MTNPALCGMRTEELSQLLGEAADSRMRSKQLGDWVFRKGALDFSSMTNLPVGLRDSFSCQFVVQPLTIARHVRSTDDVDKLLVHRGDGQVFECVLLPYRDRVSCCLSSQVGCPMGCAFCATGLGGFDRNLGVDEIVGQYLLLQSVRTQNLGSADAKLNRISHVVFMGMGEPLLNLSNLVKSMEILTQEIGLSYRHITVSTVGLVPQILELAQARLPIHLALSLHSPDDEIRGRLMPVNKRWPVEEVMAAMRTYQGTTGRKVTIEYLLLGGLTDTLDQARQLAKLIRGFPTLVNLIPFNYVPTEEGFRRPSRASVREFKAELKRLGVNVSERQERGHDIAAACGQLAGQHQPKMSRRELVQAK